MGTALTQQLPFGRLEMEYGAAKRDGRSYREKWRLIWASEEGLPL